MPLIVDTTFCLRAVHALRPYQRKYNKLQLCQVQDKLGQVQVQDKQGKSGASIRIDWEKAVSSSRQTVEELCQYQDKVWKSSIRFRTNWRRAVPGL